MILKTLNDMVIEQPLWFDFRAMTLIIGLKLAQAFEVSRIKVFNDSQLVVNQINGEYATKDMKMFVYLKKVKKLQFEFVEFLIEQLPRSKNFDADPLANLGSSINSKYRKTISIEIFAHPSIMDVQDMYNMVKTNKTQVSLILLYIHKGILPSNNLEA